MARAPLGLLGHGGQGQGRSAGQTGGCVGHAARANQLGAMRHISRCDQAAPIAPGGRDKVGVGQILCSVGIGQARRFGVGVQPGFVPTPGGLPWVGDGVWAQRRCGRGAGQGAGQHAQNLGHGHRARAGRGKAAHLVHHALGGVVKAQRFAFDGAVLAQVFQAHQAGVVGVVLYLLHHGMCDRALVKRIRPATGDALQHLGQARVLQAVTDRPRLAIGLVKIGPRLGVLLQIVGTAQQLMQPMPHRKPGLGQGDGRFEQTRPRQAAMAAVCQFHHAQHAGHTHRQTADGRRSHVHGAAFAHEQVFGGGRWGGFAPVVGPHALAVVVEQKSPATDAT